MGNSEDLLQGPGRQQDALGLTMLGIIIGVMAVIMMLPSGRAPIGRSPPVSSMGQPADGETARRRAARRLSTPHRGRRQGDRGECAAVAYAAPVYGGGAQVVYGNQNWSTNITGTTPDYLFVQDWAMGSGTVFTDQDVRSAAKVCVVGKTIVDNLFGGEDPLGKTVRVRNGPMVVVGVLDEIGTNPMGRDQDDVVLVPVTTAQRVFSSSRSGSVSTIMVKARGSELLGAAQDRSRRSLR